MVGDNTIPAAWRRHKNRREEKSLIWRSEEQSAPDSKKEKRACKKEERKPWFGLTQAQEAVYQHGPDREDRAREAHCGQPTFSLKSSRVNWNISTDTSVHQKFLGWLLKGSYIGGEVFIGFKDITSNFNVFGGLLIEGRMQKWKTMMIHWWMMCPGRDWVWRMSTAEAWADLLGIPGWQMEGWGTERKWEDV